MAGDPKNPKVGDVVFDASDLAAVLVDLEPGALQGLLTEQPGFVEVIKEILANQAAHGEQAGVTASDIAEFNKANALVLRIDQFIAPIAKFLEVLTETRYLADDKRQRIAFLIAQQVDRRSRQHPELPAKYEKTRAYRSAAAKKAVRTRQKNAAPAETPSGAASAPK